MNNEKQERIKDTIFEVVMGGMIVWCFVLLICITLMMFIPMFK